MASVTMKGWMRTRAMSRPLTTPSTVAAPTPAATAAAEQPLPEPASEEQAPAPEAQPPAPEAEAPPEEAPVDMAAEYLALAQRTQADFENFRKRAARDAAQAADRGMARLAKELLPALDHLELALQAAEKHAGGEEWVKGIRLVQDEVTGALGRVGIQSYAPLGEPFDPNEHEAMAQAPIEGHAPGTVAQVYQAGYRLNGSVLRPARVVVAQ
jgi:molecular chaperone GrpE